MRQIQKQTKKQQDVAQILAEAEAEERLAQPKKQQSAFAAFAQDSSSSSSSEEEPQQVV